MAPQKQYACNRFYLSADDEIKQNTVVVLDQDGFYQEHAPLLGERPFVEWLGGIFFLLPQTLSPFGHEEDFLKWYHTVFPTWVKDIKYRLWCIRVLSINNTDEPNKIVFRCLSKS